MSSPHTQPLPVGDPHFAAVQKQNQTANAVMASRKLMTPEGCRPVVRHAILQQPRYLRHKVPAGSISLQEA